MWPSMPISCAYVSPSVRTHVCAMFIIVSKLLLFFTWGDCSPKYHCTKTMLAGGRATFEAAYVSCRIYDHPRRQSMPVTSAKCRDVRGQAVYDRAAQCGPSIGFHLASQMFPTTDSKCRLEGENGLSERDIDQCFIYSCFKMLYEHDYFLKPFWAWCPEINSSNQFAHLVSYHCAF